MRQQLSLALLFGALGACELALPDDAYYPDAAVGAPVFIGQDAGRSEDSMAVIPVRPGGQADAATQPSTPGVGDAGMSSGGTTGGRDAGPVALDPQEQRLQALAGRYLMRMDMKSSTSVTALGIEVRARNLVSHLIVAELYVENKQLKATERLCYQAFLHACDRNCDTLTTVMSDAVVDELVKLQQVRSYTVSGTTLSSAAQELNVGFDASSNQTLPSAGDARVWDTIKGNNVKEGLLLTLDTRGRLKNLRCEVYNVQHFTSQLSGAMGGTSERPSLEGKSFKLTSTNNVVTLGSSNPRDCQGDGNNSTTTKGEETVRFKAVSAEEFSEQDFWSCPAAQEWNTRLPASL
jgi:hypothetical protein